MPIPMLGFWPCMQVVIPGGPQPCDPCELTHGALVIPARTSTLLLTGANAMRVGESVYVVPVVVGNQLGPQTPHEMCQVMNRSAGVAACARASFAVRSDSRSGSVMQAAVPRRTARRGTVIRVGFRRSAAIAFGSKE